MLDQLEERYEHVPEDALVDGGFATMDAIEQADARGCTVYAPLKDEKKQEERGKDPSPASKGTGCGCRWRSRMGTEVAKPIYRLRGQTAEWVNAPCRNRGFWHMPVRGQPRCRTIALLYAIAHNLVAGRDCAQRQAQKAARAQNREKKSRKAGSLALRGGWSEKFVRWVGRDAIICGQTWTEPTWRPEPHETSKNHSLGAGERGEDRLQAPAVAKRTSNGRWCRARTLIGDAIVRDQTRDVRHIERTLVGLLDFCFDPAATSDYVRIYREMWDSETEEPT